MRLIDADELIPSLKMGEANADTAYGDGRNGGIYFAIWRIGQMPTVDAVPRQKYEEDMENAFAHGYTDSESNFRKMIADGELVEVVRCKDCKRHNGAFGDFLINEQRYLRKDEVCPLVYWRGKAKGSEFDYQYCIYGERRTDGANDE